MTDSPALSVATIPGPLGVSSKAAAENFPVASRLLPKAHRQHLIALYGFARLVDDIGDELDGTPEDRLAALDAAEDELNRAFAGTSRPTHPVFVRLAATIKERSLARQPFADLIEANRLDQRVTRYQTYDELIGYCRLSANPVGRLVLALFDEETPERLEMSDAICTGLQLIEHWQDIAEDAAKGRCYLPAEDIGRLAVPTGSDGLPVLSAPITPALIRLVAFETSRAATLLASGTPLVGALGGWARMAVAGYLGGGLAQAEAMSRAGYDVISRSAKASKASVALHTTAVLLRSARGRR
jgi:squalene synthase HpnC